MSKKTIVLTIAGSDIQFAPTPELYGEYVGAMARGDMTDSAHNFVMQSAQGDEEKDEEGKPKENKKDDGKGDKDKPQQKNQLPQIILQLLLPLVKIYT